MKKIAFSLLIALATNIAIAAPSYKVTKDEKQKGIKRSVEIELSERATEQELKKIAETIYKSGFKNTFIGYRLPGEKQGSYWATTHFTPNLDVKIIGSTIEQHQTLNSHKTQDSTDEVIGSWRANWGFESKMTFKNKDGNLTVESIFADGSHSKNPLMIEKTKGQTRYYTESGKDHGEFYIINKNGDLDFWSENDNFYTAPKESFK